jgi:nucleoside-diphosphate-sugar epimerase
VAGLDVVTGAFSFTGRYIAEALLETGRSVRTLTRRRPDPAHPLAARVEAAPLRFDSSLLDSLRGADTLYNTYWVRFERGATTFQAASSWRGSDRRYATDPTYFLLDDVSLS